MDCKDCCRQKAPQFDADKKIRRFSKIEHEYDAPYFQFYNPQPDPVIRMEKRKMKTTEHPPKKPKPKMRMKCIGCKDKKAKRIEKEEKKIEKFIAPLSRRQQRENEERHRKEKETLFVCKKEIIRLPSPVDLAVADPTKMLVYESIAKQGAGKVVPEKISLTESIMKWPPKDFQDKEELASRIPKSKIYINKTKKKDNTKKYQAVVDSVDFIYNAKYREDHPWYEMYRGPDSMSFFPEAPAPSKILTVEEEEVEEEEEVVAEEAVAEEAVSEVAGGKEVALSEYAEEFYDEEEAQESMEKKKPQTAPSGSRIKRDDGTIKPIEETKDAYIPPKPTETHPDLEAIMRMNMGINEPEHEYEGEEEGEEEEYYSHSIDIDKLSAATSIESEYKLKYPTDDQYDTGSLVPSVINRILQKYQRESEMELVKQERQPYKKGTLKSHSTTKISAQPKSFYFGVWEGSMHYGDPTFSEKSRFRQGLPICIAAYIMSFVKPPLRWKTKDIDMVLELGDKLYLKSLDMNHLHEAPRILQPEELYDVVELADKKIKYKIFEPDIAGFTRSQDPKIYDLLKGLTLFFKRNRSGIVQTYNTNIVIFRQKHYFVFDPEPRTSELYSQENGVSILAAFYDIPSILVMLLDRGRLDNWPYIISKIAIRKIATVVNKQDDISLSSEFREDSLFKIVNPYKAVIVGTLNIGDPCFGDTKNKQAMAVATMALVYSHVTPSCAWHKKTVDKIIMVANQFHIECLRDTDLNELTLENIPAFFTIGPLMIDITIFANQYAGLMYRKTLCLFEELLIKFFCHHTSAIVEIDKFILAIWKQRDVFYCFDPYSRDREGFKVKEGVACVSMYVNVEQLIKTVIYNFSIKDYIFKIHVMKVIRINRDPEFGRTPRSLIDSEESIVENIKISDATAFKPRNITIDRTEVAAKTTGLEEQLDPSIIEVGSFVGSLDQKYVEKIPTCPSKTVIKTIPPQEEKIFDLDSPSLSNTQIEKDRPSPLHKDNFEFKLLDEVLKEEMELTKLMDLSEGGDRDYLQLIEGMGLITPPPEMKDQMVQKGTDFGLIDKHAMLTNTDLMGLYPIERQVLEPNKPPRKHKLRRQKPQKSTVEADAEFTQTTELAKNSNFVVLPDGSQILYGTTNIANIADDYENVAGFVSAVAIVVAKKYTLNTWSQEIVDAILEYGLSIQKSLEIKFSEVPKIIIPKLTIGSNTFHILIDYLFDSLLAQSILEQSLEKLVFRERESCIIVTQNYSCAVFKKRFLYYMFDPFGNNLVGLGEGPDNTGVACMFRFKTIYAMVSRFLYNKKQRELKEPTEASRFIISTVTIKVIIPPEPEKLPRREKQLEPRETEVEKEEPQFVSNPQEVKKEKEIKSKNKTGYQKKDNFTVIEGSDVLTDRDEGPGQIKSCHFICICAMIGIFGRPIKTWDTKRIDYVTKIGKILFGYVDNMNFADKRSITNLLLDTYFFDLVVKRISVADQRYSSNFSLSLDHLLVKYKFLLIQFPICCYVLYKGAKTFMHLFDPYGVEGENPKSCWIKFQNKKLLYNYLSKLHKGINSFFFYTINISHIKKASKKSRIEYKLRVTQIKKKKKLKYYKLHNESEDWLKEYPTPWSRMKKQLAAGPPRGIQSHKWFNWDVEYPGDLYSLIATKHQCYSDFPKKSRNKQTIANCIVAIVMTEIYDFTEWNSQIMDSILEDGDDYFRETFKTITEKNYEIKVEDFPLNVNVFPYSVNIEISPLIEGTLFIVRPTQFNLAKALRLFFETQENRCGIACANNGRSKTKYVAFGRIREGEYFMYDCQSIGPPMFIDRDMSKAYILRCVSVNRLLHVMTMTLRSGDFFIYGIGISEDQGEKEIGADTLYDQEGGEPEAIMKTKKNRVYGEGN